MKEGVAQMEAEAAKLRELHEQAAKEQSPSIGGDDAMETEDERLATDERSVHVANVSLPRSILRNTTLTEHAFDRLG